ncbi:Unknown protein sequence [Pseudomonas syringae pv. papulans]|nr:Unknown protein sequence [Pseudomonas syringae pv. papulans]
MHGRGHLVGLDFLAVDPCTGLLGNCRQFFSRAGNLGNAVANTGDQFAQGCPHALDALLQHTQFIASGDRFGVCQVAGCNTFDDGQRIAQWASDLTRNDHSGKNAQQHDQHHTPYLQAARLSSVFLAHLHLQAIQLFAQFDDGRALSGQILAHARSCLSGCLEGIDRAAVIAQSAFKLCDLFAIGGTKSSLEPVQTTDRAVQLLEGCCLGLVIRVAGIAAHFITHEDQVLPSAVRQLGQIEACRIRRIDLHDHLIQRLDSLHGRGPIGGHLVAHFGPGLVHGAHAVQGCFIVASDIGQFAQRLEVDRIVEADEQ